MFYEFINDLGDIRGITLIALYADLRIYMNMVADQAETALLKKQAKVIFEDFLVENNTYEMEGNEITLHLRNHAYDDRSGEILLPLDGDLFEALYEFCVGALEVFYVVFKKSDRFE